MHAVLRLLAILVAIRASCAFVTTCYQATTGSDANNCLTPGTACLTFTRTITTLNCLNIFVAAGTYSGASNSGIAVGYALNISGAGKFNTTVVVHSSRDNFLTFGTLSNPSIFRNFGVTGCTRRCDGGAFQVIGSCASNVYTPVSFVNMYLYANGNTGQNGGAIYLECACVRLFTGNTIERNIASYGGAVYMDAVVGGTTCLTTNNVTLTGDFRFNSASSRGGALALFYRSGDTSNIVVQGSIAHNLGQSRAGAVYNEFNSIVAPQRLLFFTSKTSPNERCSHFGNVAQTGTGGFLNNDDADDVEIGCAVCNNWAEDDGGGIWQQDPSSSTTFLNSSVHGRSVLADNIAYLDATTNQIGPTVTQCTSSSQCYQVTGSDAGGDGISDLCRAELACTNSIALAVEASSNLPTLQRFLKSGFVFNAAVQKRLSLGVFTFTSAITLPYLLWSRYIPSNDTTLSREGAGWAIDRMVSTGASGDWAKPLNDLRTYQSGVGPNPDAVIIFARTNPTAGQTTAATTAANLLRSNNNTRVFIVGLSGVSLTRMAAVAGDGVTPAVQNVDYFRLLSASNWTGLPAVIASILNRTCCLTTRRLCGSCTLTGPACNDGLACTVNDTCVPNNNPRLARCTGVPKPCPNATDPRSVACNTFACNNATGACVATPKAPGTSCFSHNCFTGVCATQLGVGVCVITPKNCSDGLLCTSDTCTNATGACVHTPIVCNDNNACTNNACNATNGQCYFTPISAAIGQQNCSLIGAPYRGICAAGVVLCNVTTGALTCSVTPRPENCSNLLDDDCNGIVNNGCPGACTHVNNCTAPLVPACQTVACVAFSCVYTNRNTSVLCNDNVSCTGTLAAPDHCNGFGECTSGADNCAQVQCKTRTCNILTNQCVNVSLPDGTACDDGDNCTDLDQCFGGQCMHGDVIDCSDGNACTIDTCVSPIGLCVHNATAANNLSCNADNTACTAGDKCAGGTCVPGPLTVCSANSTCTTRVCNATDGVCYNVYTAAGTPCSDDGDVCVDGTTCDGLGNCTNGFNVSIDDFNQCTVDACHPITGISHDNATLNGTLCNDTTLCSTTSLCLMGICTGVEFLNCTDTNDCTIDLCDPDAGCMYIAAGTVPCQIAATNNTCFQPYGTCVGTVCVSASIACNDSNPCTDDYCVGNGTCSFTPNTACCEGPSLCMAHYDCVGGMCVGTPKQCPQGIVNISTQCNVWACNETSGACFSTPKPNGTACVDGLNCTFGDRCVTIAGVGVCEGFPRTVTDGLTCTDDYCAEIGNGTIVHALHNCTGSDRCRSYFCNASTASGACVSVLSPLVGQNCSAIQQPHRGRCAPGVVVCNPLTGVYNCSIAPITEVCGSALDNNCDGIVGNGCNAQCNTTADCSAVGVTQCETVACINYTCVTQFKPAGTPCNDTLYCTVNDTCQGNSICIGAPRNASDGLACTSDYCIEATDSLLHVPTQCNNGNMCQSGACVEPSGACVFTNSPYIGQNCSALGLPSAGRCAAGRIECNNSTGGAVFYCNVTPRVENCTSNGVDDNCDGVVDNGCGVQCVSNASCASYGTQCLNAYCGANFTCLTHAKTNQSCNDSIACTDNDRCTAFGTCIGRLKNTSNAANRCVNRFCAVNGTIVDVPIHCDDNDRCTDDSCDPATGACIFTNSSLVGQSCSVLGFPVLGACAGGQLVCNASTGGFTCNKAARVENCTNQLDDNCDGVVDNCLTPQCYTNANCTPPTCTCSTASCVAGRCVYTHSPFGTVCNRATDNCTANSTCDAFGNCVGGVLVNCPPHNATCAVPVCDAQTGVCALLPYPYGTPCDDGDNCTLGDQCAGNGTCLAGAVRRLCTDDNNCTQDTCISPSGLCVHNATANDGRACERDFDKCTSDVCVAGVCLTQSVVDCGNPVTGCKTPLCAPQSGVCYNHTAPAGTVCYPNLTNRCIHNGVCYGNGTCAGGTPVPVNDFNPCTVDSCDPSTGLVSHVPLNGTACNDGSVCTQVDVCLAGTCTGLQPLACPNSTCLLSLCSAEYGCMAIPLTNTPCVHNNSVCAQGKCIKRWVSSDRPTRVSGITVLFSVYYAK